MFILSTYYVYVCFNDSIGEKRRTLMDMNKLDTVDIAKVNKNI